MPQGTHDFVDEAVDILKRGGHSFLLVVLHDRNLSGSRAFNIRTGFREKRDVNALRSLTKDEVQEVLAEDEQTAE